jgi:hypothetical protein
MLTRRSLLERCIALATAASAAGAFARPGTRPDADLAPVATLLVDACSGGRDVVGRADIGAGTRVLDAGGDLAPILYGTLLHDWRRQSIKALAGFTSAMSLFYVEHVAYDWGLRTVFLARHGADAEEARWVRGPDCMLERFALCARLRGWRSAAVSTSLRLPVTARPLGCSQAHLAPDMIGDGALYSWTLMPIAPVALATTPETTL